MTFDTTIRLSDLFLIGGGLVSFVVMYSKFVTAYAEQGEFNRLVLRMLGSKTPPDGMLGDIDVLKRDAVKLRNWQIEISAAHGDRIHDRS